MNSNVAVIFRDSELSLFQGKLDYDGMKKLKYLEMCLNESLRLYMPVVR